MLYLLKSGEAETHQEVADLLAGHRHTISNWLCRYEEKGMEGMLELKIPPNRAYSLSAQEKEKLQEQLKILWDSLAIKKLADGLKNRWGLNLNIRRCIRSCAKILGRS